MLFSKSLEIFAVTEDRFLSFWNTLATDLCLLAEV